MSFLISSVKFLEIFCLILILSWNSPNKSFLGSSSLDVPKSSTPSNLILPKEDLPPVSLDQVSSNLVCLFKYSLNKLLSPAALASFIANKFWLDLLSKVAFKIFISFAIGVTFKNCLKFWFFKAV